MENKKIEILSTISLTEEQIKKIQSVDEAIRLDVNRAKDAAKLLDETWNKTEILLTSGNYLPTREKVPNLRWIHNSSAGVDTIIEDPLLKAEGIVTTSSSGVMISQMGEYIIMALLMLGHKMPRMIKAQKQKQWIEERYQTLQPKELRGSTVGIVGYGSIGREVARQLYPYGTTVLAAKRDVMHPEDKGYTPEGLGDPKGNYFHRLYPIEALQGMLKDCDFVVITLPQTAETENLFNKEMFNAMKPGSYLVNVSRGPLVNEPALIEALSSGHLGGAVLDVFHEEPLPSISPLWEQPNLIITPHISAFSPKMMDQVVDLFVENLKRYLKGEKLYNQVDVEQGY